MRYVHIPSNTSQRDVIGVSAEAGMENEKPDSAAGLWVSVVCPKTLEAGKKTTIAPLRATDFHRHWSAPSWLKEV